MIPEIHIEDFNYPLPDERIAKYPLPQRDASKLLVYSNGVCRESIFRNLAEELPAGSMMVFNDTKVVPARMFFRRSTGAHIEIFCLEPVAPSEYVSAFAATSTCCWKCVIGNAKRWKDDILELDGSSEGTSERSDAGGPGGTPPGKDCSEGTSEVPSELHCLHLRASLVSREGQTGVVRFEWQGGVPFSRVLELCGQVPIPPYLNRGTEAVDLERYQTLYAHIRGSVAAPTAGLHFTEAVLQSIDAKSIDRENVCLHVGAGTFLPVKSSLVSEHPMHREPFVVSRSFLEKLRDLVADRPIILDDISRPLDQNDIFRPLDQEDNSRKVIAVGTTSVRTLESLYYVGVSCIENGAPEDVDQWAPYTREYPYTLEQSLGAIIAWLDREGLDELKVGTRIIIVPGFRFRVVDMMVTNFHQPQSTLLLLISAFVGGDWHTIYDFALSHNFRFLSYGDSSLLRRR